MVPIIQLFCPTERRSPSTSASPLGSTTRIMPIPMLKTRSISSASTSPVSWRKWKSSGIGQLPIRIRAWVSAGSTRGRLSVMPPPVMWAMPCRAALPSSGRIAFR